MEEVVKLILKRGADVSAEDRIYNLTPLTTAIENKQDSMVRVLLNAGALVDKRVPPD